MDHRFSVTKVENGVDNGGLQLNETNHNGQDSAEDLVNTTSTSCLYDVQQNNKRKKSFFIREALPRLENYRNSKRAIKRPSLWQLHGEEKDPFGVIEIPDKDKDKDKHPAGGHGIKLGWIQGVLIPCLLNIWGVMLFLRLSWVVAQAGIFQSLVIIGISALVCVITTLSLSAICTNGEVKGGGIYYIISRSLGPEFGASVGIVFAFANAVAASMNTIGFCNSLNDMLKSYGVKIIDGDVNDTRIVGTVAIVIMIIVCAVGMEWESKAQNFLVIAIIAAILDFLVGAAVGPGNDVSVISKGFVGFSTKTFWENWGPSYRFQEGVENDFFSVFAIFFPSVTGIQAGANICGDLKDPASAIPKGTLLAVLISMISYVTFVFFAGTAALRDASGHVVDIVNGTVISNCTLDHTCQYGLFNSYSVMNLMSSWGPLIYVGCFAATLSTALTNLLSVPRLIQALGIDKIYPGLIFFSKGYGKSGEPYRGYVLTFLISVAFLLIANLNAIAPLISNFYLASYALINFCTFHAALIKPLGWRPTFRWYNCWLSLFGFIICVIIMFLINWQSSLITFFIIAALYLIVVYRKPDVNWGSSTQAQIYKSTLKSAHHLNNVGDHVKNYQPNVLLLSGAPHVRPPLLDFASLITKNNSLLIVGEIVEKQLSYRGRANKTKSAYAWFRYHKVKGFYTMVDGVCFENGAKSLLQATGIGKLSPNILMMGFKNDWKNCNNNNLLAYFNTLHSAFDQRLSVCIVKLANGLDYSRITEEEDPAFQSSADLTLNHSPSRPDLRSSVLSARLMHADSNLSISHIAVQDSIVSSFSMASVPSVGSRDTSKKLKNKKRKAIDKILYTSPSGKELPRDVLENMAVFKTKQKGTIDVWWLYDDGGLTMLLPYIISTRTAWQQCKLRVFALTNNTQEAETETKNMADLLSKFRLNYSSLTMVQLADKPKPSTIEFFETLIDDFRTDQEVDVNDCRITESELLAQQEKTFRQLRLRELLVEHSTNANLVVMSLPMPRKGKVSAPLYMAWLETLTRDMPPYVLIRGNQQSVLTFYS